jgi:SAM-dependent methyltransferase
VDYTDDMTTIYKLEEIKLCGRAQNVDIVSPGDCLPFADKSYDFIISSHVIEHFFDPVKAIKEWLRVSRKYVFMIVPHRDRTFDRDRQLTTIQELEDRHSGKIKPDPEVPHGHFSVWTGSSFVDTMEYFGFEVMFFADTDDKAKNGFTVVLKADGE